MTYEAINNAKSIKKTSTHSVSEDASSIRIRIEYTEKGYTLSFAVDDKEWQSVATLDLIDMTGPDFVGPVIGVFALGDGGNVEVTDLKVE